MARSAMKAESSTDAAFATTTPRASNSATAGWRVRMSKLEEASGKPTTTAIAAGMPSAAPTIIELLSVVDQARSPNCLGRAWTIVAPSPMLDAADAIVSAAISEAARPTSASW